MTSQKTIACAELKVLGQAGAQASEVALVSTTSCCGEIVALKICTRRGLTLPITKFAPRMQNGNPGLNGGINVFSSVLFR
jgi:hypothetical protein